MTVSNLERRSAHTGNAVTTLFAAGFKFFELDVYLGGDLMDPTAYSVDQDEVGGFGDVIFNSAPAAGQEIVIVGSTELSQPTDYTENDDFSMETLERGYDRLTMMAQEQQQTLDRSMQVPITETDIWDARDYRITDVANGTDDADAVNKGQLDALAVDVQDIADNAVSDVTALKNAAASSASNAASSETNAGTYASEADQSADDALISEQAAADSAASAAQSAQEAASGGVQTINNESPDVDGNVDLSAADVGAAADDHNHDSAYPAKAIQIATGGGLSGGGDLSANRTLTPDFANNAEALAGTSDVKVMNPLRTKEAIDDALSNVSGGKVLQVVQTVFRDTFTIASQTPVATPLTAAITPSAADSKILVQVSLGVGTRPYSSGHVPFTGQLRRDGALIADAQPNSPGSRTPAWFSVNNHGAMELEHVAAHYLDSPATDEEVEYALYASAYSASYVAYINRTYNDTNAAYAAGRPIAIMTLTEVAA